VPLKKRHQGAGSLPSPLHYFSTFIRALPASSFILSCQNQNHCMKGGMKGRWIKISLFASSWNTLYCKEMKGWTKKREKHMNAPVSTWKQAMKGGCFRPYITHVAAEGWVMSEPHRECGWYRPSILYSGKIHGFPKMFFSYTKILSNICPPHQFIP